jgi:hypothetical protein
MDIRYLAGLVDADGSLGFSRARSQIYPRIMVVNTSHRLLREIKACYGGCISTQAEKKAGWKRAYTWSICHRSAIALAERLEPHLRLKHFNYWLFYAWDAIRPGRGGRWSAQAKDGVQLLIDQCKWLNQRGIGRRNKSPADLVMEGI